MSVTKWFLWLLVAAFVTWGSPALAQDGQDQAETEEQEQSEEEVPEYEPLEDLLPTPDLKLGSDTLDNIIIEGGAGISAFTGDLGESLNAGPSWDVRGVIGAKTLIGAEVNYFGAVNDVDDVGIDVDVDLTEVAVNGTVTSNALEGLVRINFLPEDAALKPFLAGGAGYFRQDSDIERLDDNNAFSIPLAAGVQAFVMENVTVGARAEFKTLFGDTPDGNQWGGVASVGANF